MSGYSCMRDAKYLGYKVYGMLRLPTNYAGICPGDTPDADSDDYLKNILPEMFFGMYSGSGLDIGVRVSYNATWHPFIYGYNACDPKDGAVFSSSKVTAGTKLYMIAWIEKSGSKYYAKLNVSKTGYNNTDLMSSPLSNLLTNTTLGSTALSKGLTIRRENVIASNPDDCEESGCYSFDGQWLECGFVTPSEVTYVWTDANSTVFTGAGATPGASGRKVLELRSDSGAYDPRRIMVTGTTDTSSGATETVRIDFRPTPAI